MASERVQTRKFQVSEDAVITATGRGWQEWFDLLNQADAANQTHSRIVRHLKEVHEVSDWWCQMITVAYEQATGRREVHQKADGFQASASKTVNVPVEDLYAAWVEDHQRAVWLTGLDWQPTGYTALKAMRGDWPAPASRINIYFFPKGPDKSQVTLQHSQLANAQAVAEVREFWKPRLQQLKAYLEQD